MEKAFIPLFLSIVYVSLLIPSAYAQSEQIEEFVEGGIETIVDEFTEELDFSDPNLLNATEQETENLKDSGLEMVGTGIDLLKTSHGFAQDLIQFLSPVHVDEFLLFIVAGAIAVVIAISLIKRIAIHIMIFVVITLLIIGLLIFFYY